MESANRIIIFLFVVVFHSRKYIESIISEKYSIFPNLVRINDFFKALIDIKEPNVIKKIMVLLVLQNVFVGIKKMFFAVSGLFTGARYLPKEKDWFKRGNVIELPTDWKKRVIVIKVSDEQKSISN